MNTLAAYEISHSNGFLLSTNPDLIPFDIVYDFLENQSYWGKGMGADRLRIAIQNSLCFGIYDGKSLCGFSRVITDKATFAYLCDVFILPQYRGKGLSKWMVQSILAHPALQTLRRWSLATADAHGLYEQYGFVPLTKTERWMEIYRPYQTTETQ